MASDAVSILWCTSFKRRLNTRCSYLNGWLEALGLEPHYVGPKVPRGPGAPAANLPEAELDHNIYYSETD